MEKPRHNKRFGNSVATRPSRVDAQRTAAAAQAYAEAMLIRHGVWTNRPLLPNQEGYDVVCTSRERPGRAVRIQVKGRWATDSGPPKIRTECLDGFDYLVFVRLNAGYYYPYRPLGLRYPELYVFPNAMVRRPPADQVAYPQLDTYRRF